MNKVFVLRIWMCFLSSILTGCAIGFDHTLFVTKSNVGIDIDTKPPTAEISIARRELVIAPTFEGGQTPPVLAGFRTTNRLLFGFDVSSVFAGGDAALTLSQPGSGQAHDAKLCLDSPPVGKPHLGPISLGTYPLPTTGEIRPFIFGTDTTFGLKVAWSGMTAQFPDSLKLGFNRKELALAPVFGSNNNAEPDCPYSVEMPAFLATIETPSEFASPQSSEVAYRQSFSTGTAAIELAGKPYVKQLLLTRLDRASEKGTYDPNDPNSECINKWLYEGENQKAEERAVEINDWWMNKGHIDKSWPLLISAKEFTEERIQFIKDKSINCEGGQ